MISVGDCSGPCRRATLARFEQHCAGLAGLSCGRVAARADRDLFFQDSKVVLGRSFAAAVSSASGLGVQASALV